MASHAIKNGYEVCVFDNLFRVCAELNLACLKNLGKVNHIHGDIRSHNDVERVIKDFKPDSIFHLAGQFAMTTSIANSGLDFENNGLESVLRYSPHATVIYSSTNKVYGNLEQSLDIKLDYSKNPVLKSDQKVFIADLKKISDFTGWKPQVSYNNGIKKMLEWLGN